MTLSPSMSPGLLAVWSFAALNAAVAQSYVYTDETHTAIEAVSIRPSDVIRWEVCYYSKEQVLSGRAEVRFCTYTTSYASWEAANADMHARKRWQETLRRLIPAPTDRSGMAYEIMHGPIAVLRVRESNNIVKALAKATDIGRALSEVARGFQALQRLSVAVSDPVLRAARDPLRRGMQSFGQPLRFGVVLREYAKSLGDAERHAMLLHRRLSLIGHQSSGIERELSMLLQDDLVRIEEFARHVASFEAATAELPKPQVSGTRHDSAKVPDIRAVATFQTGETYGTNVTPSLFTVDGYPWLCDYRGKMVAARDIERLHVYQRLTRSVQDGFEEGRMNGSTFEMGAPKYRAESTVRFREWLRKGDLASDEVFEDSKLPSNLTMRIIIWSDMMYQDGRQTSAPLQIDFMASAKSGADEAMRLLRSWKIVR